MAEEIELSKSQNTYTDEELQEILKQHKLWISTKSKEGKPANLSKSVLIEVNLRNKDLRFADLIQAELKGVKLRGTMLQAANLTKANLTGSELRGANLMGSELRGANLMGSDLTGANLMGSDLTGANLKGANLKGANLKGANLKGANLKGANLKGAHLIETDLTEANCQEAGFIGANLHKTNLDKTNLSGAKFLNDSAQALFLRQNIEEAQFFLATSLKNTDLRIIEHNKNTKIIGRIALELMGLELFIMLLYWYHYEKIIPIFDKLNALALPVFGFPILIILTIIITLFRHQKKLLDEVRHYSADKRQIELYSGLLKASQYASAGLSDPQKSAEYVQNTFTAIRDRILSEQLHTNTAGSAVEQEEYSSSLEPLIKVISDMIAKSEVKK